MSERIVGIVDEPEKSKNNDTLGIGRHATALTEYVRYCPTPMTIGIQGEWGSGKTSLLEQIKESLEAEDGKYLQIWVNAWEQSLLSTPEETLIKIIREVIDKMTKGVSDKAKVEAIKQHASSLFKGAVRIGATMAAGNKAGQVVEEYFNQDSNIIKSLRKQLTDVAQDIRLRNTNPHEKIIIYVDDLDRVEPKDAVSVLELLKNIFNIPNCVFILAIDYQVVIKGLEHKFGKRTESNEWEFRAFFDKIIQLPFMMPMGQYSIGEYVSNLLGKIGFLCGVRPIRFI
jgi:predicted KAP-like P-loop ATPase